MADNLDHLDLDLAGLTGVGNGNKTPEQIAAEEKAAEEARKKAEEDEAAKKKAEEEAAAKGAAGKNNEENEEEDEDEEEDDEDKPFIAQLQTSFGFEELTEEEFEDTEEGLISLTRKAAEVMSQRSLKSLFEQDPILAKHFEFKRQGGDSQLFMDTFYPKNDWSKVSLQEDEDVEDTSQHEAVLMADLIERGFTEEDAKEMVNDLKVAGTIVSRAKTSLAGLKARQSQRQEALIEAQRQEVIKKQKEVEDSWKEVNETIKASKDLAGLPIKESEKQSFFDYLNKPVNKEGHTQRQLDLAKLDMSKSLALDFLLFKGFDISNLVQTKAKTQQAASLRDKIKGGNNVGKSQSNKRNNPGESKNVADNVDWSAIHTAK